MDAVFKLTELTESSLNKYFNSLISLGYISDSKVDKLLLLLFIKNTIFNKFNQYITEEDFKIISNTLYCLFGSNCLIDYPKYYKEIHTNLSNVIDTFTATLLLKDDTLITN